MAEIDLQDAQVWVNGEDRNGRLAFINGRLLGVLVQLKAVDEPEGKWFLEAGFGPAAATQPPVFDRLDQAQAWLKQRVEERAHNGVPT